MPKPLVTDAMWGLVEPLLPPEQPKPKGGRPRVDSRAALAGILFVPKTGIPWEMLPQEMGCGSGMTCWRRLKEWHESGVWDRLHRVLLGRLGKADRINRQRASLDSATVPAPGGEKTGPNPTDRGKRGSKRHLIVDGGGVPLTVILTAANVHDAKVVEELLIALNRSDAPAGDVLASAPRSCMQTRATTFAAAAKLFTDAASRAVSLDAAWTRVSG